MTVSGRYEDLKELAVVFDYGKFEMARELGLISLPARTIHRGITPGYIEDLFERLADYPVTSIIFDGQQALGIPMSWRPPPA